MSRLSWSTPVLIAPALFVLTLATACDGSPELTLSADNKEIAAGGTDFATITAEVRLGDDNPEEAARRKSIAEVLAAAAAGEEPELLPIPTIELEVQGATAQ